MCSYSYNVSFNNFISCSILELKTTSSNPYYGLTHTHTHIHCTYILFTAISFQNTRCELVMRVVGRIKLGQKGIER